MQKVIVTENESAVAANEVNRREFLWLTMMSSAMLMGAGSVLEAEQMVPHARLRELAPGAVRPEGWLREMLEKQAAQLGSSCRKFLGRLLGPTGRAKRRMNR